jgi:hypothetical protein
MKTAAIMQPTLMPWLGYFALMDAVDIFIYLDDVQYVKRSWQSRNRIKSPQRFNTFDCLNRTIMKSS